MAGLLELRGWAGKGTECEASTDTEVRKRRLRSAASSLHFESGGHSPLGTGVDTVEVSVAVGGGEGRLPCVEVDTEG